MEELSIRIILTSPQADLQVVKELHLGSDVLHLALVVTLAVQSVHQPHSVEHMDFDQVCCEIHGMVYHWQERDRNRG